jgi:CDP-diacylglycerol--glycerol-3-phosphate 3-phosphatidyltransferase
VSARALSAPRAQLPNALTVLRLALVPVFAVLLVRSDGGHSLAAAAVFALAAVTDQVDGYLARRWHVESRFGAVADPLADRLMIDVAVLLLWLDGRLPFLGLVVILGRDVLLLTGAKLLQPRGLEVHVNFVGKTATWILYASIFFVLLTPAGTRWPLVCFWIGVVLAVVAGVQYVLTARRELRR